jgi:hypothetical protein
MASMAQLKSLSGRILLVGGLLVLSACSQSIDEDKALLAGDEPVPKDTKYPDFSKPLTSAMDQMSDDEAKAQEAQLAGLASQRRRGTISEAEYRRRVQEMRKLKATVPEKPTT